MNTNSFVAFMAGHFDPPERRKEYDSLRYYARTHKPRTKRVHIKGECDMRRADKSS